MTRESSDTSGIATLVIKMPGTVRPPTDTPAAMVQWLAAHGAPRTAERLKALERDGWVIEVPDPGTGTQEELWATAEHNALAEARAAARPYEDRVGDLMRWTATSHGATWVPVGDDPAH